MGNCSSTNDDYGAAHSASIDRQIEEDSKIFRKECKILLLGKSFSFNSSFLRSEYGFGRSTAPLAQNGATALSCACSSLARGRLNVGQP